MITYVNSLANISADNLTSTFFVGWLNPPSPETHLQILQGSYEVWLALDDNQVVGFINSISDGVLSAYIPLLEVIPEYQGQGIGLELTKRMLDSLHNLYSIDLLCDGELQTFYAKLGMQPATGMLIRNYNNQAG